MAITTYAELKTAVANWISRTDLTVRIPEFIALAEADIRRNLRDQVIRGALSLDSDAVDLPNDVGDLRLVRFNTTSLKYPLISTTPENLATLRRSGSGVPRYFTVVNGDLLLDVTPDTTYESEILYSVALVPLSDSNTTNHTLTASPDIYLFGALKEAEPYLEHDERNILWSQKFQKAVADENAARERAELAGAPKVPQLPIVFG